MRAKEINKIQALKNEAFVEGEVDEDFLLRFAEETGWKSVLLYQYLSGYIIMIAVSAFIVTVIAWLELMHAIITPDPTLKQREGIRLLQNIIYLLDLMYAIDIMFRIAYSLIRWPNKKLYNEPVSLEFIILDLISTIPFCTLYGIVQDNSVIIAVLRLRVTIRLYRISTSIITLKKMFHKISVVATLLWSVSLMLLSAIVPASAHYITYCYLENICQYRDYKAFMAVYCVACRCLFTIGADIDVYHVHCVYHFYSILSVVYFMFTLYLEAELTCKIIDEMRPIYSFIRDYEKTMNLYNAMNEWHHKDWQFEDEQINMTLRDYYHHYLRERNGISALKVLNKILPESLSRNIIMDMAFDSFRHSHIFRNLPLNIIRFLSTLVKFEFAVPGQIIVHKGQMFNKMLYISHGVLQILSHEDGETPVLNLSGGTSLGETTLFVAYALKCTIICQTYCELIILEKGDFKEMIAAYPEEYHELVKIIMERFEEGKKMRKIVLERMDPYLIKTDYLIMSWIKQFQRCFLHNREGESSTLDNKIKGLQYYIDNLIFYICYLDKLVVSEDIELVKDSVFLKATYHFVLQPRSPILMVWNVVVLLLTILFILTYPFNLCYPKHNRGIQTVYTIFITFLFWIDIYLKLFTAVRTRGATYLTFKTILVYRIRQKDFLFDCVASIPLEYFIMFLTGKVADTIFMLLQANRLLKYYKIDCFFDELNLWNRNLLTFIRYIKYVTHFLFFYYYAGMITYILNCFDEDCTQEFDDAHTVLGTIGTYKKLWSTIPLSTSLVSGVIIGKMPYTTKTYIFLGYTMIAVCAYVLNILFLVNVIASSASYKYPLLRFQEDLLGIAKALTWFDVTKNYKTGIDAYLNSLFNFESDIYIHFNNISLPEELCASFRNIHLKRVFAENKFFKNIPIQMLNYLTSHVKIIIIPKGLVIFYCGQTMEEFYIIQQGLCTMWYGNIKRTVTCMENLGLMEVLLGVPIFHTIISTTDCILLKITKQDLQRCLDIFEEQALLIADAITEFERCEPLLSRKIDQIPDNLDNLFKVESKELLIIKKKNKESVKKLIAKLFKKIWSLRIRVINSGGRFFFYFEIVRNSMLVLSLYVTALAQESVHNIGYMYILLFFDLFQWLGIVINLIVSYYNKHGIEVRKISKTMVNYLSHSFAIDAVGSFPFDVFLTQHPLVFTRMNRFLLTHKLFGLAHFLTKRIKRVSQYTLIPHVIFFTAFTLNIAIYYITVNCKLEYYSYRCSSTSVLTLSKINKRLSQFHAESMLFFTSFLMGVGFRRYTVIGLFGRIVLTIWSIAGHIISVIYLGRAVAYCLFRNADLTIYQEAMRDLVRFMNYCDIDKNIRHEVIQYFEYIWEKREGKDIADVINNFPTSVKKDLMFNIYGGALKKEGSVFEQADDNFLKSLLMIARQETFRKTGIIYKIDDIHGKIFFLLKGSVEAVGPDTNRLVSLIAGSLFGCLDNCEACRQTLTMVANGHVETLSFSSVKFYKLLVQHPQFHSKFYFLANMHFDFIKALPKAKKSIAMRTSIVRQSTHRPIILKMDLYHIRTKIFKPNKHFDRLQFALYFFEFFFGTAIELLNMILFENIGLLTICYIRDILWLVRLYFIFHFAYEDEFGMLEFRRSKIAMKYIRQKDGFYFDLFCFLPFECIVYFFSWTHIVLKTNVVFFLRLNRLFRVYYLFRYMSKTTQKLNINVLLMRIIYTLMYVYVYTAMKFVLYYWSATLLEKGGLEADTLMHRAINYLDTIFFMFSKTPVPYEDTFDKFSPTALCTILYLDFCTQVFFYSSYAVILQITTKIKSNYLETCNNLKLLMLICNASPPLIDKIQMYTTVLLRVRNGIQFPFLLERAPYYLREAVLNSMFGFHLRNHYLFKDCHVDFLRQLAATMRTLTYFEENHICDKGDIDGTMYFIQEGVVLALTKDTLYAEVCEHLLVAGESFGLNQILYPHSGQYYTYRTSVLTTVVTIKRVEFVRLLTFFPSVKKHIYNRAMEFAS